MASSPTGVPTSWLNIRRFSTLLLVGIALYATTFPIYFAVHAGRSASELGRRTEHVNDLYGTLATRSRALSVAVRLTRRPIPADAAGRSRFASTLRSQVNAQGTRLSPGNFAEVPPSMRVALARVDDHVTRLQIMLLEYAALLELGRLPEAEARQADIDGVNLALQDDLALAQRLGLQDLVKNSSALRETGRLGVQGVLWWLAIGITVVGITLWVLWRRVNRPLRHLEAGLDRVARGDLDVRLPVLVDDELGRLLTHFNQMTEVLHRRAQDQGRFVAAGELIAGIAHEVNNPLMAISALVSNRLAEGEPVPAEVREELTQVLRQARRAGRLLSGLLRFVRPDSGRATTVDLNLITRESLDLISYRFQVEEVELDEGEPLVLPMVQGNPGKIEQVLVNLLSNAADALKEVAPPRLIRVRCNLEDEVVRVTIEDNGPGIKPQVAARLFYPFTSSKGDKGTGLGLYISREIAREAGGDLRLGTGSLGGACFVLTLLVARTADGAPQPAAAAGPTPESKAVPASRITDLAILVVDDEPAVRSPISRFLRRRGARVEEAGDGLAALDLLKSHEFDVILADVRMPRMDGVGLYLTIERTHPAMMGRVLFLSGDISQLQDLSLGRIPSNRMVIKPVELFTLEDAIADLLATAS